MEHLTYAVYTGMGGAVPEAAFPMLEARAHRLVDTLTHGRLAAETPLRACVQYCLVQLIDAMAADAAVSAGMGREVASMSNDGVTVTFASGGATQTPTAARNARIVREWLDGEVSDRGVLLLYAGVEV